MNTLYIKTSAALLSLTLTCYSCEQRLTNQPTSILHIVAAQYLEQFLPAMPIEQIKIIADYSVETDPKERAIPIQRGLPQFCTLSHNNKYLAVGINTGGKGCFEQGIAIYDTDTLAQLTVLQKATVHLTASFSYDDTYIITKHTPNSESSIWKTETWEHIHTFEHDNSCDPFFFAQTHNIALKGKDTIKIINIHNRQTIEEIELGEQEDKDKTNLFAISSDGTHIALAGGNKITLINRLKSTPELIKKPAGTGPLKPVPLKVAFSPKNAYIIWELGAKSEEGVINTFVYHITRIRSKKL